MTDDYGSSVMIMPRDRKEACEHADVAVIHHQHKVFQLSTTKPNKHLQTPLNIRKPHVLSTLIPQQHAL